MSFLRDIFTEDGAKSGLNSSQVLMFLHAFAGIYWVTHFVRVKDALPDAVTLAGITAFVIAPYGISQLRGAVAAAANGTKTTGGTT